MPSSTQRTARRFSPRTVLIPALLMLTLAIVACSAAGTALYQNAGKDLAGGGTVPGGQPASGRDVGGAPAPGPVTTEDGKTLASLADQKIIKTGEISVEVPDLS